jgi:translation initiation factor IF-2
LAKVRVFSLAKELGLQTDALLAALAKLGVENVTKASAVDEGTAAAVREIIAEQAAKVKAAEPEAPATPAPAAEKPVRRGGKPAPAPEAATPPAAGTETPAPADAAAAAAAAAATTGRGRGKGRDHDRKEEEGRLPGGPPRLTQGMMKLEEHFAALQERLDDQAPEDGKGLLRALPEIARRIHGDRPDHAVDVPPVVTVMGHIDHGKTSLLDALRNTQVAAGEAGGITQHIGASEISRNNRTIVFLDTPGHAAFTAMRARGAQVTDIAIIVVAADDGVMPQTVEAISHAKAAGVPIVVALNKIDVPGANPDRVKQQLLEHELVPEEWGGDTIVVPMSALTGEGLDDLVGNLNALAEVQEFWADPQAELAAVVVEAKLDSSQGPVATVLVRNGTLAVGDYVACGATNGRVRRMRDWRGKSIKAVEAGHPAEVVGLSGLPDSGDVMVKVANPKEARALAEHHTQEQRDREVSGTDSAALRGLYDAIQGGTVKELNVIIKADAWGSAQALESALLGLNEQFDEVRINVIHTGVGNIGESDVLLALASKAIIVGFHVDADAAVRQAAGNEHVEIRTYKIIYEALEDFHAAAFGLLEPIIETRDLGDAEVLQVFRISRIGVVAGCRVLEGELRPNADIVVTRDGEEIHRGRLTSLKRFNNDVSLVQAPSECGVASGDFRGWRAGDRFHATIQVTVERRLQPLSSR